MATAEPEIIAERFELKRLIAGMGRYGHSDDADTNAARNILARAVGRTGPPGANLLARLPEKPTSSGASRSLSPALNQGGSDA